MNTVIFLISFSGFLCTQMVLCRISVTELTVKVVILWVL